MLRLGQFCKKSLGRCNKAKTSGTSGSPISVFVDCLIIDKSFARNRILQQLSTTDNTITNTRPEVPKRALLSKNQNNGTLPGIYQPSGWVHPCVHRPQLQQQTPDSETHRASTFSWRPNLASLPEVT